MSWEIGKSEVVLKTPIWDVIKTKKYNNKTKAYGDYVSLKCKDWISVVIYNVDTQKFVMIKEFRHGINDYIMEFPSGTVEDGENPIDCARREVQEETGYYNVLKQVPLFEGNPNTAFHNNKMHCYYFEVTNDKVDQQLDANEDVEVVEVTYEEMCKAITSDSSVSQQLALAKYTIAKMYAGRNGR